VAGPADGARVAHLGESGAQPSTGRVVAVFGGSFNPPHVAHVLAVVYALSTQRIDRVLVVPVLKHPFAKELAPFDDRLAMCRAALEWIPHTEVSTIEAELGGESRTLRTIEELARRHPDWSLRLLVGADVLPDLPKWHRFDRIAELASPIVLGRAGTDMRDAPEAYLPQISSTEVREAIAAGRLDDVRARLPLAVIDYIVTRGLYGNDRTTDGSP
jgi:nicotinate-nucleotide adenylyltransferase